MIDRIAKLIALAENAATEEEAAAAFAKAQQLSTRHAISLEEARLAAAPKAREEITTRTVRVGDKGKRSNASLVNLFDTIGRANDVRCLIQHDSTMIYATGYPSDLDNTEALWSALAATMTRLADALVRDKNAPWRKETTYTYVNWEYVEKPVTGQGARRSFTEGFISKIGSRLQEARSAAIKIADQEHAPDEPAAEAENLPSSMALMMRDKSKDVEAHMWSEYERKYGTKRRPGSWKGGRSSATSSSSARAAGKAAGASASLTGRRAVSA